MSAFKVLDSFKSTPLVLLCIFFSFELVTKHIHEMFILSTCMSRYAYQDYKFESIFPSLWFAFYYQVEEKINSNIYVLISYEKVSQKTICVPYCHFNVVSYRTGKAKAHTRTTRLTNLPSCLLLLGKIKELGRERNGIASFKLLVYSQPSKKNKKNYKIT